MKSSVPLAAAVVLVLVSAAPAMFMRPAAVPVDRIVGNAEAYVDANPEDANGHYVLGRAHYLAWTLKSSTIPSWPSRGEAAEQVQSLPPDHMVSRSNHEYFQLEAEAKQRTLAKMGIENEADLPGEKRREFWEQMREVQQTLKKEGWKPEPVDVATLDYHAETAIRQHHKAIELDPKNGLYHIGLASLLEEYAERGAERSLRVSLEEEGEGVDVAASDWQQAAAEAYVRAYRLAAGEDVKLRNRPIAGLRQLVSYNAILGYRRVSKALPPEWVDGELLEKMAKTEEALKNLPPGPITPIVLSLDPNATKLDRLLAPADAKPVRFDLDGDGRPELRPWVRPDTAFLVWDPMRTGQVTSGRQMFGSVSFWLLPGDGYRAMDLLDDNRDGELAGGELRGLALWHDRNSNGVSDPGEVTPLETTSIAGLRTTADANDAGSPMSTKGLRLHDGAVLPTWDWIAPRAK